MEEGGGQLHPGGGAGRGLLDTAVAQSHSDHCIVRYLYLEVGHEPLHGGEDAGVGVQELLQLLLGGAAILTPQVEATGCRVTHCRYAQRCR